MRLTLKDYEVYKNKSGVIYYREALRIELGVSKVLLQAHYLPAGGHGG